jgi:hypothetical protein
MTRDWTYPRFMGDAARRTVGAERTIRDWQESAYRAALEAEVDGLAEFAASLRGKATAYKEAADVVNALHSGRALPRRWTKRPRRRWRGDYRAARIAEGAEQDMPRDASQTPRNEAVSDLGLREVSVDVHSDDGPSDRKGVR